MKFLNITLIFLLAFTVSSCRLTGKKIEEAAPTLETQLTPVKPDTADAPEAKEETTEKPKAN